MSFLAGLYDPSTESLYPAERGRYVADEPPYRGLSAVYDYKSLRSSVDSFEYFQSGNGLNRFLPLLPVKREIISETAGERMSKQNGLIFTRSSKKSRKFKLTDTQRLPGGSLWYRAAVVALTIARDWEQSSLLFLTEGPAAQQAALIASENNMQMFRLFHDRDDKTVPETMENCNGITPPNESNEKKSPEFGLRLTDRIDSFFTLPGWNPYFIEGIKTVSYEIFDLFDEVPDEIYLHDPSGLMGQSVLKGFTELQTLGWLDSMPEVVSVRFETSGIDSTSESSSNLLQLITTNRNEADKFLKTSLPEPRKYNIPLDKYPDLDSGYDSEEMSNIGFLILNNIPREEDHGNSILLLDSKQKLAMEHVEIPSSAYEEIQFEK